MTCTAGFIPMPATIADLHPLSADTTLFRIRPDHESVAGEFTFSPGQFFQLSVPGGGEIPVSVAGLPGQDGLLEFCVRRVGHVTAMLHRLDKGARLGIRGPFGNGFPFPLWHGHDLLLLAGGLGMAPLRSLLYTLLRQRLDFGAITLMYGARDPAAFLFREELAELSGRSDMILLLTVDSPGDGPATGLTCQTGLLPRLLTAVSCDAPRTIAAMCGPPVLYRYLVTELLNLGIPEENIFLSLERRMKCGMGLCCHCAVGGFFCCTDGPVFRLSEIKAERGAL